MFKHKKHTIQIKKSLKTLNTG